MNGEGAPRIRFPGSPLYHPGDPAAAAGVLRVPCQNVVPKKSAAASLTLSPSLNLEPLVALFPTPPNKKQKKKPNKKKG